MRRRLQVLALVTTATLIAACSGTSEPAPPAAIGASDITPPPSGTEEKPVLDTPQSPWARDRIRAINAIWSFSAQGRAWMQTYDFRQMVGQPTYFGSTGFQGFAGAGQAIPRTIMHELSHSFWGVFGAAGNPGLDWTKPADGSPSEGIAAYRADLVRFMAQPPDRFEPLRDRFRNLPGLSLDEGSDLFHFGEAEMVNMTGGDIDLIPPILRPYYSAFLTDNGVGGQKFDSWADALTWFQSLSDSDRAPAGEVFAVQHFPLDMYRSLDEGDSGRIPPAVADVLAAEERQRLADFAEQFDTVKEMEFSLVDAAGIDRGFQFWRGYIREMSDLHLKHPAALPGSAAPRAAELAQAMDFYHAISDAPVAEQVARTREQLDRPAFRDLAVLLDPRALIELFGGSDSAAGDGLGGVLAGYTSTLARLAETADAFIEAGRTDSGRAAAVFDDFMAALDDDEVRTTAGVLVDLLRDAKGTLLADAFPRLADASILRLLDVRPELARAPEITPARLLGALGVTRDAGPAEIALGGKDLFEHSSGNFAIDRPVDEAFYDLLAGLEPVAPGVSLAIMRDASLDLMPWMEARPDSAAAAISNDMQLAARLISGTESIRAPAARDIHRLIAIDPGLAAGVVVEVDRSAAAAGESGIAPDVLAFMVYDRYWSDLRAGPVISLENDARFLARLGDLKGVAWLQGALDETVSDYTADVAAGRLEAEYPERHAATLEALADRADSPAARTLIAGLLARLK